jgi:hypothetical protein
VATPFQPNRLEAPTTNYQELIMKIVSALLFAATAAVSFSASALTTTDMFGSAVGAGSTQRTIKIDSNTRYVNVTEGDTVTFTNGDQMVSWQFDGVNRDFPLSEIFPAADNAQNVEVFVQPNDQG